MSEAAQAVSRVVKDIEKRSGPLARVNEVEAPTISESGVGADPAGDDDSALAIGNNKETGGEMAKKTTMAAKKAKAQKAGEKAKPAAKKAVKAPKVAKPRVVRAGKKGLLLVTAQSLPVLVRAVQEYLKMDLADGERVLLEALLQRAKARVWRRWGCGRPGC